MWGLFLEASIMDELLQQLEQHIVKLLKQHHELKHSNHQLHQGRFSLLHEKEVLLDKQRKAINQIESLVNKLKAVEKLT